MTRPRGRSERAGRGPAGPAGTRPGGTPPPPTGGSGWPCLMFVAIAAVLAVISVSIALTPLGVRVWASQSMTSWMAHDAFMVGLLVAAVVLYLGVSLFVTRFAVPPAGPRVWGARSSRPGPAPEPTVSTSPGPGSGAPIRLPWLGMSRRGKAGTGQAMPGTAGQGNNKRPRT